MEELARLLGWPTTIKRLKFRPPNIPFLAPFLFDRRRSDPIGPPWPDLVLCGEALTSVIARRIWRKSKGQAKVVCLGRPAGTPHRFDLVLTTPQYRLPKAPNVIELALPLTAVEASMPRTALPGLANAARPITAVLIGGSAAPELLNEMAAVELARALLDDVRLSKGTLVFITSPRTGKPASRALTRAVAPPHILHLWQADGDNPYLEVLDIADRVVVTSDSPSMAADALAGGKPVSIYRLPQRWTFLHRTIERLYGMTWGRTDGKGPSFWLAPVNCLFDSGIIEALPDRRRLFDRLAAHGWVSWFGEAGGYAMVPGARISESETAAHHVLGLFQPGAPSARL